MAKDPSSEKIPLEKQIEELQDPVTIVIHITDQENEYLEEVKNQLDQLSEKSENIEVKIVKEEGEPGDNVKHLVDHFPAFVVLDKDGNDHGIRFYGAPMNNIYDGFLKTIIMLSRKETGVGEEDLKTIVEAGEKDLQLLLTPNAPNTQTTIETSLKLAYISEGISVSVIDLIQFPEMAEQYHVLGIPKTIINEEQRYTGPFDLKDGLDILTKNISDAE
ncbi:MAG: thioredoxin family protein [Thermoplasmatota archaeon]